jgi:hypothetical protein
MPSEAEYGGEDLSPLPRGDRPNKLVADEDSVVLRRSIMGIADPLRTEHALLPQLEALPAAAIATEGREDEVLAALDAALAFLRESLIPHARAEDAALYPRLEQVMHAPGATATMSRDHLEVVRLTAALQRVRDSLQGAPDPDRRRELQRILYGRRHHPTALRQGRGAVSPST